MAYRNKKQVDDLFRNPGSAEQCEQKTAILYMATLAARI